MNRKNKPSDWIKEAGSVYNDYVDRNYTGISGIVFRKAHTLLEKGISTKTYFTNVLEVGAGFYSHYPYVKHGFDNYVISDTNPEVLKYNQTVIPDSRVSFVMQRTANDFESNSFDRVIASQVMEHIYPLEQILSEWVRALKPEGILSIGLPCDPGMLWRLCRRLRTGRLSRSERLAYD